MDCPDCNVLTLRRTVPADLRAYADGSEAVGLCPRCLGAVTADDGDGDRGSADEPATEREGNSAVAGLVPDTAGGAALALALARLDSLALERAAVVDLCEYAEREGIDVHLTLDRLAAAETVEPQFDIDRRRAALETFL